MPNSDATNAVVVVGAGVSGIRAALDLAQTGQRAILLDQSDHIGGILTQLDAQFPTDHCGMCRMLPHVERDAVCQTCLRRDLSHPRLTVLTSTEVSRISGEAGNFTVHLRQHPSMVDPARCTGCGLCAEVCPVEAPDGFNAGLTTRRAIYRPVPHGATWPYVIDPHACTRCGQCVPVCPTGAIRLEPDRRQQFGILVVDDELIVRDSLRAYLGDAGYGVHMAASGREALEMLEAHAVQLMLADIRMPGMDGVELLQRARADHPDLTVIMMTAYAAVESAVDAMKIGALDYLVKPFDPDDLVPLVDRIYLETEAGRDREISAGAVVLSGGAALFDPRQDPVNPYGYGRWPGVVTQLEFERLLSGSGPTNGRLLRPGDGAPVTRIAWLQCVGSRDRRLGAPHCSSACCMISLKQARLVRERWGPAVDTQIYYMDLRTAGREHERYCDDASQRLGIRLMRGRIHSVDRNTDTGRFVLRYVPLDGNAVDHAVDLVVLAVGQRHSAVTRRLAAVAGLALDADGFWEAQGPGHSATSREGIFVGSTGMTDIATSLTRASAAACEASRLLPAPDTRDGSPSAASPSPDTALQRDPPRTLVVLNACSPDDGAELTRLAERFATHPQVCAATVAEALETPAGWQELMDRVRRQRPNRIVIGTCAPHLLRRRLPELVATSALPSQLIELADIQARPHGTPETVFDQRGFALAGALSAVVNADPAPAATLAVEPRALVLGGGIAGMTAALALADHGIGVDLVERDGQLGGQLAWLQRPIGADAPRELMARTVSQVQAQARIRVHLNSTLASQRGSVGRFTSTVRTAAGGNTTIDHGVTVLAVGAHEAPTDAHGHGRRDRVITQSAFDRRLAAGELDPAGLAAVVMIQCVESRQPPRQYCSRVCCPTALRNALRIREANPETFIAVFYRDMMTLGRDEALFSRARRAGVVFVPYTPRRPPEVRASDEAAAALTVHGHDPVLNRPLEITADLVVLATGMVSALPDGPATLLGLDLPADGFFPPADPKWRPLEALQPGMLACGTALSPRNVDDAVDSARAAAIQALQVLRQPVLRVPHVVAEVHHNRCALCQTCIGVCPYDARRLDPEEKQIVVDPLRCQGCGLCAAACPNDAAVVRGYSARHLMARIDAALEPQW